MNWWRKAAPGSAYNGERIGQGRENARTYLVANPEAANGLDADLRKKLGFEQTFNSAAQSA